MKKEMKEEQTEPINDKVKFICPNDGEISQDDVVFLCNTCDSKEAEHVDGVYMCSNCKTAANPLMCRLCESKDVHMHGTEVDLPGKDHPQKEPKKKKKETKLLMED